MRQLVYDIPTRLFHWIFAILFLIAFIIGKTVDDDSSIYSYHMLAGLIIGFLVILRIIWGFIGTKYARFTGFVLNPNDLIRYFKGFLTNDKTRWIGHNPASSWVAIIMMVLALALGITGYTMTSGSGSEFVKEIHEVFANTFIILVIMHITGVILHTLRHQEMISLSMIDGKKSNVPENSSITSARPVFGILLISLLFAYGFKLYKNYDPTTRKLQFFGSTLQLSESEESEGEEEAENENDD